MSKRITRRNFLYSSSLTMVGCGASLSNFPFDKTYPMAVTKKMSVSFYGVGCCKIQYQDCAILTDPFWSYLPLKQVAFGQVLPDPKQVDPYLDQLNSVQAVVIGHNHYDHNLDLPYIADHLHQDAHILGSQTMVHTFAPNRLSRPLIGLNQQLASEGSPGKWWIHPNQQIRILPILSDHPKQYLFFHLYKKKLKQDRKTVPKRVSDYQEGVTMGFLIDFLVQGSIARRVYVQTSSTGYPMGFFPEHILAEHQVDVALLAMDCANLKMAGEYTIIDYLTPSVVLFCHWEDFFRSKDEPPREIVKVDLPKAKAFFQHTSQTTYLFPALDSHFQL